MRTTYITATVIALAIGIWLVSGQLNQPDAPPPSTLADQKRATSARLEDKEPTRVRARVSEASNQARVIKVRGRTENKRTVTVRAETSGTLVGRPVDRGARVSQGDLLCRLSVEDRQAGLLEAREAVNQARIEYEGSLKLQARGLQSETAIAQTKARLASAQAQLKRRELDLERTYIRAPFDAFVEDVHVEIGDFVQTGTQCATLVDLDPMLLVGRVPESEIELVQQGEQATGLLSDGRRVQGPIRFVGQQSDDTTRTYAIEIELPNPDYRLRSGITTDILIPVETVSAHKVSPALFGLADDGTVGIRTLTEYNIVAFHPVEVVAEAPDGVWISGLPDTVMLITVGQELVVPGERVEVNYEAAPELPASAPVDPANNKGQATAPLQGSGITPERVTTNAGVAGVNAAAAG